MLNRLRRLLKILGIVLILCSLLGLIFAVPGGGLGNWQLALHDTYFVNVRVSPLFFGLLLVVGIGLWLYDSQSTA
jgi:hypothetical protein